jgi:protein O-GlcNAc transferase
LRLQVNENQALEWRQALERLQSLTAREPLHAVHWHHLGMHLLQMNRPADAVSAARLAVSLVPDEVEYRLLLADVLRRSGHFARALAEYEMAATLAPSDVRVAMGLGAVLTAVAPGSGMGRLPELRRLLEEAQRLEIAGQPAGALEVFSRCARFVPGEAPIYYRMGCLLQDLGQNDEALSHHALAARIQPELFGAVHNAGKLAAGFGLPEKADRYLREAHRLRPAGGIRMRLELLTEAVPASAEAIFATRARFEEGLDRLLEDPPHIEDPLDKADLPTFLLAYHGVCNRHLHTKLARVFAKAVPDLGYESPHCLGGRRRPGRTRVGFISQFMRGHSIGKVARGLVAELCRERFEVYVLNIPPLVLDDTARWIKEHSDHWLVVADTLKAARAQIAALELDILFYQDIGMELFSYLLAFSRLAPVQCVSYGHPDTTGIPTMDYYISNDSYEPAGASEHYSERLVELHDLPTLAYYFRPTRPQPAPTRAQLGLPADARLYVCAQTLFKLHPDFDRLLGNILERDGMGRILLFNGNCAEWSLMLQRRLRATLGHLAARIQFLPRQRYDRFLEILGVADVVLDTLHFNGMNTSIDAFSMGTPVVTLPGTLQRGRFTRAMYRTMGIDDGVAANSDEYVELAVDIATNSDRRRALKNQIVERSHLLFEDRRAVAEFERFFLEALRLRDSAKPKTM